MARLFLSYAREDRAAVEPLAAALERAGHDLWWDRKIAGGAEYSGEIEAALERAEAVIVVWSRTSARSAWVRDEAAFARDQGKLLPVVIDDGGPPLGFRQIHAVDLREWNGANEAGLAELMRAIDVRSSAPPRAGVAAPPPSQPHVERRTPLRAAPAAQDPDVYRRRRKVYWVVGAVLLVSIVRCNIHVDDKSPRVAKAGEPKEHAVVFNTGSRSIEVNRKGEAEPTITIRPIDRTHRPDAARQSPSPPPPPPNPPS